MSSVTQVVCIIGIVRVVESFYPMPEPMCHQSCPKIEEGNLNIHLVPHTHLDLGWTKTVDQYYSQVVTNIFATVVSTLWNDTRKRFILAETAFFWRWWNDQSIETKHKVNTLVQSGRLQFVNGGWSMCDEATTHYQSIIDQFTWGLSKLNQTFGECGLPLVGWQIDPFGHSREFASLLAAMGYQGLFLGRIDYQDRANRVGNGSMEMLWRGDDDLGPPSDIFTSVLFNTYYPPDEFNFANGMASSIKDSNVESKVCEIVLFDTTEDGSSLANHYRNRLSPPAAIEQNTCTQKVMIFMDIMREKMLDSYTTNNLLIPVGGDFNFYDQQASTWFKNLDRLIEYANQFSLAYGQNIKLFYSTPDCYLRAVRNERPLLPIKQDDFFPYASWRKEYWTGYYTSRPTLKYLERSGNSFLQMVKQLQLLTGLDDKNLVELDNLRGAMGILQHHDAITGTEQQHVAHDYEKMLNRAIENALIIVREAFTKIMQGDVMMAPLLSFTRCPLHESACQPSEENDEFIVTVYNILARTVEEAVRIPVPEGNYEVFLPSGDQIFAQVVDIPPAVLQIPTRKSFATHELVFISFLAPMAYKSYYIRKSNRKSRGVEEIIDEQRKYVNDYAGEYVKRAGSFGLDSPNGVSEYMLSKTANINMNKAYVKISNLDPYDREEDEDNGLSLEIIDKKIAPNYKRKEKVGRRKNVTDSPDTLLGNGHIKLSITKEGISEVILPNGKRMKFNIQFFYYVGSPGDGAQKASGAYIFLPFTNMTYESTYNVTKGPTGAVLNEIRLIANNSIFAAIRIYNDFKFIEIDWVVGPIHIKDGLGKEYIVRYITDIENKGEFYTDSNGRQMLKRRVNERPQWNLTKTEEVAGNYYPVTNQIYIEDNNKRMAVLTDRSEGGTSLNDGQIELMLHRRLLYDDRLGVDEALNEYAGNDGLVVRGRHRIFILDPDNKEDNIEEKKQVLQFHLQPQIFVSPAKEVVLERWIKMPNTHSFANDLPKGIHLLTVEPWFDRTMLLRIENYLENSDDSAIDVDLTAIFKTIKISMYRETTLAANLWMNDLVKWSWTTKTEFAESFNDEYGSKSEFKAAKPINILRDDKQFVVKVRGKQIRTFVVQYESLYSSWAKDIGSESNV